MPYTGDDETSILTRMATLNKPVYEVEMPEDSELTYNQYGAFNPYYVVAFNSPYTIDSERSLLSVNKDPYRVTFIVTSMAGDVVTLRTCKVAAFNLLSGWEPTGSGEIKPEYGRNFKFASNAVRPTVYGHSMLFSYMTNISL